MFPCFFRLGDAGKIHRSVKDLPETRFLECPDPPSKPTSPTYSSLAFSTEGELPLLKDFSWLLGRNMTRALPGERETHAEGENGLLGRTLYLSGLGLILLYMKPYRLHESGLHLH